MSSIGRSSRASSCSTIKNPFSVGVYLVDGRATGSWSIVDGRVVLDEWRQVVLDEWRQVGAKERREVERERAALEAFHA